MNIKHKIEIEGRLNFLVAEIEVWESVCGDYGETGEHWEKKKQVAFPCIDGEYLSEIIAFLDDKHIHITIEYSNEE